MNLMVIKREPDDLCGLKLSLGRLPSWLWVDARAKTLRQLKFLLLLLLLMVTPLSAFGQAGFSVSASSGCNPLTVYFTNSSVGDTAYSWNFGDGSASVSSANPSKTFSPVGVYTVTLTGYGHGDSTKQTLAITVYPNPTAGFYSLDTVVCPGAPVTFADTSNAGAYGPLTFFWTFGDGNTSTLPTPVYSYAGFPTARNYGISLTVRNSVGCSSPNLSKANYIHVNKNPSVAFTADTFYCKAPATVNFVNASTGYGHLSSYWRFGDGLDSTSTVSNPAHEYLLSGSYTVSLIETDSLGCEDSVTKPSYIKISNIHAAFGTSASNCVYSFNNLSTPHISSHWIFGDGDTSNSDSASHTYTTSGPTNITLIIFDGTCYDTSTQNITIASAPTGTITQDTHFPCWHKTPVTFTGIVPSDCTVLSWLFGDGLALTGNPVSRTYYIVLASDTLGGFIDSVHMTIANSAGCVATVGILDTIFDLNASVQKDSTQGCKPFVGVFSVYAYSRVYRALYGHYTLESFNDPLSFLYFDYHYPITSYSWNFGDGSAVSTEANPIHTYSDVGVYNDDCFITFADGCDRLLRGPTAPAVYVGTHVTGSFSMTPSHACANETISFASSVTGTVNSYEWGFGDGVDSVGDSLPVISHQYYIPARFIVSLYLSDNGCVTRINEADSIDSPGAVINVEAHCTPRNVVSLNSVPYGSTSQVWMFRDGTPILTDDSVVHTFDSLTNDTVVLATYSSITGCRDTAVEVLNLTAPLLTIAVTDSQICRDIRLDTVESAFVGNPAASSYNWFLNGALVDSVVPSYISTFHVRGLNHIMLVVTDGNHCLDTAVATILVAKPIDSFAYSPPIGCLPLNVNFSDYTTDVAGASITGYYWDFGNGFASASVGTDPSQTYTVAGTYRVEEITTDNLGCLDTFVVYPGPQVNKPVAAFIVPSNVVCENSIVHFTNTSLRFSSVVWNFGDGTISTAVEPEHVYTMVGAYAVTLVAKDSIGCISDTFSLAGRLLVNPSPVASFTLTDSFAVCPPLNVTFTNTSTGVFSSYTWYFSGTGYFSSSTSTNPVWTYNSPGYDTVALVVTNSFHCYDTAVEHVRIFGYSGAFYYTPINGCSPQNVLFTGGFNDTSVTSVTWDFGDGTVYNSLTRSDTVSHTYITGSTGIYYPKLILADTPFCPAIASVAALPIKADTMTAAFTIEPNPACEYSSIILSDSSHSLFSADTGWSWSFGTGDSSSAGNPTYIYSVTGHIPVALTVTDRSGCVKSVVDTITVIPGPRPITGIFSVCAGSTTSLSNAVAGGSWGSLHAGGVLTVDGSGLVTGIAAGTALVTYQLSNGCAASAVIMVNKTPSAISGIPIMCAGYTSILSDTTAGGRWSSSNTAVATVGSVTGVVAGISDGTALITYAFGAGSPGSCGAVLPVTVAHAPSAIIGPLTVCNGQNITLSDTVAGGEWLSSNGAVATVATASGIVTGVSAGTARITYSIGNVTAGCRALLNLTVLPLAPIAGPTNLCAGLAYRVSDPILGGTWQTSSTIAPIGLFTGILNSTGAVGTEIISYTLPTGCVATATVTVNPEPAPIGGNTHICRGYTTSLSDTGSGAWSSTGTTITTSPTTGVVTGISVGTGIVTYTLPTGCYDTVSVHITSPPGSISGPESLCTGSNNVLADLPSGGSWLSANASVVTVGTTTGIVTGVAVGTAVVSYIYGGCSAMVTLTVNPIPASINGYTGLCVGTSATWGDSSSGGTWSSGNYGIANINLTTGYLTALAPGTTMITYTLPTGCFNDEPFAVGTMPPPILGGTNICVGSHTTLTDAGIGGIWSSGDTTIAAVSASSGVVTGISAGTAKISYTTGGCPATMTVLVNPLPAAIAGDIGCTGLNNVLTDSTAGGTWSTGGSGVVTIGLASGVVSGISSGTALITYKLPTGCLTTFLENIRPTPPAIAGPPGVCLHSSVALSDLITGGHWNSSNPSVASVDSGSGVVTGIETGSAILSYEVNGCPAFHIIDVSPLPGTISGPDSICAGGATGFVTDDSAGGSWSGNAFISVNASGMLTSVATGLGMITYSLSTGCFVTKAIVVKPTPGIIYGDSYVCLDSTITLVDLTPGGTWSSAAWTAYVSVGSLTGGVTGIANGTAIITYQAPNGCIATTTISVNPKPFPIVGDSAVCAGSTITLTDVTTGGFWTSGAPGIVSIGSLSGRTAGVAAGTATITFTVINACGASIKTHLVLVNPLPVAGAITGDSVVCMESHVIVEDTSGGPGIWSASDSMVTVSGDTVFAVRTGAAIISYSVTNICGTAVAARPMTVDSLAPILPIVGSNQLCAGGDLTLADGTPSGVWSCSDSSASVSAGIVIGIKEGTAIISYSITNICGVASVMDTLTVAPLPPHGKITGDSSVCFGTQVVLSETLSGGTWSMSNESVATISDSGRVTEFTAGIDTAFYSTTNICGTTKDKLTIDIKPSPLKVHITTEPSPTLCVNTQYQNFGADTIAPPGEVYTWSASNSAEIYTSPVDMQYCLIGFSGGGNCTVKLVASMAGTDCVSADSVSYSVSPTSTPDPGVVYYDPELVCTDNTADSYQWGYDDAQTLDSTLFPGEINENYYNAAPDLVNKYYWVLTFHNGCIQKSYFNPPLKVKFYSPEPNFEILLYPNPAETKINIAIKGLVANDKIEAQLYDGLGNEVRSCKIVDFAGSITLEGCAPGVYQIMIIDNGVKIGAGSFIVN